MNDVEILKLSSKIVSNEKITLVEDDNIVKNDENTASVLNELFSDIITTLGIPQDNETEIVSQNIVDPLMKAIIMIQPSIIVIKKNCKLCLLVSLRLTAMKS